MPSNTVQTVFIHSRRERITIRYINSLCRKRITGQLKKSRAQALKNIITSFRFSFMASTNTVKIIELCQVAPTFSSPESVTEFSLPLTFMDMIWFKFPPVERIFFYELTQSTPTFFTSVILPKLKKSLSYALLHFLPLAGHLTWPQNSPKPTILYSPSDTISLTIAESNAEFSNLSGNLIREAIDSRPYVPELPISDSKASIIALQITLFPNKGFCIGIINHHAVLDGKSTTNFMKAWAYICKYLEQVQSLMLPEELTPFFDREVVKDVDGLEMLLLNQWMATKLDSKSNPRSLKVLQNLGGPTDTLRATFELSREDIKMLRERVLSQLDKVHIEGGQNPTKQISLSTFVLTCAYMIVSMVKARGGDGDRKVYFVFSVDCRSRLDPPIPQNYFGNVVCGHHFAIEARVIMEKNGVAEVAQRIRGLINRLEKGLFEGTKERMKELLSVEPGTQLIGVAGSTHFGVYGSDFGWGRPKKVDIASIDRTGAISLAESRDGTGGVEIGLVLERNEMNRFASLFANGLKDF